MYICFFVPGFINGLRNIIYDFVSVFINGLRDFNWDQKKKKKKMCYKHVLVTTNMLRFYVSVYIRK